MSTAPRWLDELLSDDVRYAHSNATVDSKASYLELLRTGNLIYLSLEHTTEAVVSRIGEGFHFDPLGSHKVKGHSPVKVWGIRTARAAPAAVEAEAVQ